MQAGINNVNVYHLHIQDNRLVQVGKKHRCPAHMATMDADKAVKVLKSGKTVYLYADDVAIMTALKTKLQDSGVAV